MAVTAHTHHGPNGQVTGHNHAHGDIDHSHDSLRPFHVWTWKAGEPAPVPVKVPAGRAMRHYCLSSIDDRLPAAHARGEGKPKRKRCAYCGGTFTTETGLYGVFHWVPDAKARDYSPATAVALFTRSKPADAMASEAYEKDPASDLVARWIYLD
jgi:hypothetical protein